MTSLQQQLAQRMAEVKERLSNICNGMLHDSPPPPAALGANHHNSSSIPGSSSFFSPPASPPELEGNQPAAAGGQSPWNSHPGTVQHAAGSNGRSASEPGKAAAGRLGAASACSNPAGQVGAGRYCAPQDTRAGNEQGHPAALAAASAHGNGDTDPAAALAAIKASIHSNPDVPGFFTTAAQQHASDARWSVAGGQRAGSRGGSRASGSGVPPAAAAAQASWASTDDAAGRAGADDSDEGSGSWATVDELEQQQQQVNMNEQHGQRTTTEQDVNSNAEGRMPAEVVFSPIKSAVPQSRRTRQQSK